MPSDGLSDLNGILYMFHDTIAIKGQFPEGNVGQKSENLSRWPFFAFFVHNLWFLWERIMPSDELSGINGILYMFYDSIPLKFHFQGGNVGLKKQWKLVILAIFAFFVHKLWFLRERIMPSDELSDLNDILYMFHDSIVAIKGPFPVGNVGQKKW